MVGLELPVLAMEHMYLVTEDMPEVVGFNKATGREMIARASTSRARSTCGRSAAACCSAPTRRPACPGRRQTTPWDFGHELLPPDLDRIAPSLEVGFKHFPALAEGRHQAGHQRPLHLRARRQPAGRAGAGPDATSGCACARHGRLQPGRRRRAGAVATGWSNGDPGLRRLGHGRRPLRRMGDAALHQRQGARELFAPLLASASPTRSCRPRGRCRRRRSTTR